jgi:hypothetical protein
MLRRSALLLAVAAAAQGASAFFLPPPPPTMPSRSLGLSPLSMTQQQQQQQQPPQEPRALRQLGRAVGRSLAVGGVVLSSFLGGFGLVGGNMLEAAGAAGFDKQTVQKQVWVKFCLYCFIVFFLKWILCPPRERRWVNRSGRRVYCVPLQRLNQPTKPTNRQVARVDKQEQKELRDEVKDPANVIAKVRVMCKCVLCVITPSSLCVCLCAFGLCLLSMGNTSRDANGNARLHPPISPSTPACLHLSLSLQPPPPSFLQPFTTTHPPPTTPTTKKQQ